MLKTHFIGQTNWDIRIFFDWRGQVGSFWCHQFWQCQCITKIGSHCPKNNAELKILPLHLFSCSRSGSSSTCCRNPQVTNAGNQFNATCAMPDKENKNDWMKVVKKVFSLCNCYQHFRPLNMCATQFYEKKSTTHLGRTGSQTTFVEYLPKNDLPELLPTVKYYIVLQTPMSFFSTGLL